MKPKYRYVLCFFLAASCCFSSDGERSLRLGIHRFPLSLNPIYVTDETSQAVANKVYESLFFPDEHGKLRGQLVVDYHLDTVDLHITLRLVSGRCFSNGSPFCAQDVIATLELCRDKRFAYPYRTALGFIERLDALDSETVRIHLRYPLATWQLALSMKILDHREIACADPERFRERMVSGTGPYRFDSVDNPLRIRLVHNPCRARRPAYPYLEFIVVSEPRLAPLKLIADEIDICELQPVDAALYPRDRNWRKRFSLLRYRKFGFTYLVFNLRKSRISKQVRRLCYNRLVCGDFIRRFLMDQGVQVNTPFMLLEELSPPEPYEIHLLQEPVRYSITTNAESKLRKEFVLFLCEEMRPYGLILVPKFLEYQAFLKGLKTGRFDLAVSGFMLDIDHDLSDIFSSDAYFNYSGLADPLMDKYLESGLRELKAQRRRRIYRRARQRWRQTLPLIPLFNLFYHVGIGRDVCLPESPVRLIGSTGDFLQNITAWKPAPCSEKE